MHSFIGDPIVVVVHLAVPPDKVWLALTSPDEIKRWYFDLPGFTAATGYQFSFEGGSDPAHPYIHRCEIVDVSPLSVLSYTWRYEGYPGETLVTFKLKPENSGTVVTLTHEGLASLPASNPDFARSNFEAGWNSIVGTSLPKYFGVAATD